MMPMMIPMRAISRCATRFVAYASAFGGVEMGSTMALLDAMATPMRIVDVPPIALRFSPIAVLTTTSIGMSRAAVAELEMKFERM